MHTLKAKPHNTEHATPHTKTIPDDSCTRHRPRKVHHHAAYYSVVLPQQSCVKDVSTPDDRIAILKNGILLGRQSQKAQTRSDGTERANTHIHAHTYTPTYTHTHTQTHTQTHTYTHTHTHTHTPDKRKSSRHSDAQRNLMLKGL